MLTTIEGQTSNLRLCSHCARGSHACVAVTDGVFLYFLSRISRTVKENKAVNFSLVCVFSFQFSLMYLVCSFQFCFYLYNRW